MIKESDIRVRDREVKGLNSHQVEAEVLLRASGSVPFEEGLYGIERMKVRLKQDILHKVYGEILHAVREELYDLKSKVAEPVRDREGPWVDHYIPLATLDHIDAAYNRLINLITEKMKVTQP
jgi:hypothetical protein